MKSILVPVDGSESAGRAAAFAAQLARPMGCKLVLFHAYDAPSASVLGLANLAESEVKSILARVSQQSFESARAAIGDVEGLQLESKTTTGHPSAEIVHQAKVTRCDLIVMGSRGLSLLQELTVGSVSDRVVRSAPCAVTIVR